MILYTKNNLQISHKNLHNEKYSKIFKLLFQFLFAKFQRLTHSTQKQLQMIQVNIEFLIILSKYEKNRGQISDFARIQ